MSSEAVKKQILTAISSLNVPLAKLPSEHKIAEACSAAKLLRNRVLREYARVEEQVEALRQKQLYDDSDSGEENEGNAEFQSMGVSSQVQKISRQDFLFISEMMVMENVVVPLLLAHGMNFSSTLLPQLLKLLTSMLLPVPAHSLEIPRQVDYIRRLVERCGTDEFFTLLIQCVAPVAEKRSKGDLQREDVVLLEVVLKLLTHFFTGPSESIVPAIGAFSRNHGIELFLVVLNQNYARTESRKGADVVQPSVNTETLNPEQEKNNDTIVLLDDDNEEKGAVAEMEYDGNDGRVKEEEQEEEEEEEGTESEGSSSDEQIAEKETDNRKYNACMLELLEGDEQLWKWNMYIVTAMAAILRCADPVELAQLGFVSSFQKQSSYQIMGLFESGKRFRECKKESDRWRCVARSRNGAISSNSLLVRGTPVSRLNGEGGAIGSTSTLLGLRSKDPLEKVRDIDSRKKGRYVKGMTDDTMTMCNLPLPTKIQLSQQCLSFICYGFEPLNLMVWNRLARTIDGFESIVRERNELIAGYKSSGEDIELPTQLEKSVYDSVQNVLDHADICALLLRYTREVVRLSRNENGDVPSAAFHQQWRSISNVITLDHMRCGFELLRVFLSSPDLKKRFDVTNVATYLTELLMTLNHLVDGDIVKDSAVIVAARALASSVVYCEESITLIFDAISRTSAKVIPPCKAGVFVLLVYSVLRLMEKCSFRGSVLFPKRERRNDTTVRQEAEDTGNPDLLESDPMENEDIATSSLSEMINELESDDVIPKTIEMMKSPTPLALKDVELNEMPVADVDEREVSIENVSLTSSGRAIVSTLSSEREVSLGNYFKRLATVKNIQLLLSSLRHWRANPADVNTGLVYLINSLLVEGNDNVFFSAPFLIVMRDILSNGKDSHSALYEVCDQVVYNFFNPSFAKILDERKKVQLGPSYSLLGGAQSFLGFEVSLRCARSLFCFNSTDYSILEEKGLPHLMDSTVIPLNDEYNADETAHLDNLSHASESPLKKRRRKRKTSSTEGETKREVEFTEFASDRQLDNVLDDEDNGDEAAIE
ncbi:hypothetical protein DQ04_02271090 [Trypanosoma grayi]|uniref:hypothetical protein n=1 Tax=Trypanosoma grayi TaxID=71804 RepID=UPI0004F4A366|nr:hypothetical protein DQ04_02271090 [Trypanosoma grayi]KEG11799.1 hypothetical protein DQ04_02271090 [Trypanosoma grayi]